MVKDLKAVKGVKKVLKMMLSSNDIKILHELRKNSRQSFVEISRKAKIPVSTVFEKYKKLHQSRVIYSNKSILDFSRMNAIRLIAFIRCKNPNMIKEHLERSSYINNLSRVHGNADFIAEMIFPDTKTSKEFISKIKEIDGTEITYCNVIEQVKAEEFLP